MPKHTAERILDAAEGVFAERGYDAASLGDVADRVGIRPQAIYNHFSGKRELYLVPLLPTASVRRRCRRRRRRAPGRPAP